MPAISALYHWTFGQFLEKNAGDIALLYTRPVTLSALALDGANLITINIRSVCGIEVTSIGDNRIQFLADGNCLATPKKVEVLLEARIGASLHFMHESCTLRSESFAVMMIT